LPPFFLSIIAEKGVNTRIQKKQLEKKLCHS
jgi:hypothetical protein